MKFQNIRQNRYRYPVVAVAALVGIWLLVGLYLMLPPAYATNWSIVLPHVSADTKISLDDVGQASVSSKSPFSMPGISPVESYKQILLSAQVRKLAAHQLGVDLAQLPTPKVNTILQTSVIKLSVKQSDPDLANKTAYAFHDAFVDTLNSLRQDEIARREESLSQQISHYQDRVNIAQQKVLEHRAGAELMSVEQFDQASRTLSDLKAQRLTVGASLAQHRTAFNTLASQLGITPGMANDAFSLQADATFQSLLQELASVSGKIPVYNKKWGKNHPKLAAARHEQSSINDALQERSWQVVGHREFSTLQLIALAQSPQRAKLFADMLSAAADTEGLATKAEQIDQDIVTLDRELRVDLRERAQLEALNRDYQVAEAVFVSALTKLDGHRSDVFSVYPMVQLLSPPSAVSRSVSPIPILGIAAGMAGTMVLLITLFVIANREKWVRALLKNK